jgi:hypothetical protein
MDENLINIYKKYSDYLTEYEYLKDYNTIPHNCEILYISKTKNVKKRALFIDYIEESVFLLQNNSRKNIYIYPNQYYIFYKKKDLSLKDMLTDLINNNFVVKKK